jgi:hypothetical protein
MLIRRLVIAGLAMGLSALLPPAPAGAVNVSVADGPMYLAQSGTIAAGLVQVGAVLPDDTVPRAHAWLTLQAVGRAPIRDIGGPESNGERAGGASISPGTGGPDGTQATAIVGGPARPNELQRQGSVVAVFEDPADPLIVLAVENGYVTVRLRCGALCPSIHRGDYVIAEGRRRSEAVFDAEEVWVVVP